MKQLLLGLALAVVASWALGDQLVMNNVIKDGSFQGFEKSKFQFLTSRGKFIKEQASRVTKMVLAKPLKATYLASGSKEEETALLKSFDKQKFVFEKDKKEVIVTQAKMIKIDVIQEEKTTGGGGGGGGGYPIPSVDLAAFAGDLTPAQQTVLDRFKASKTAFDAFVNESADMVARMDKATGNAREDLLNQLRLRKNQEQPLKQDLVGAYKALVGAFSEEPEEPGKAGPATKAQPAKPAKTAPPERLEF